MNTRRSRSSVYGRLAGYALSSNTVNRAQNTVNAVTATVRLRKPAEVIALQERIAEAAARLPAKVMERETGIAAREAEELATAMRLPRLPNLQKLTRHDPACLEAVVRFLAGQTGTGAIAQDPARVIAELIRRLQS
jgi:ribosomal protein S5